MAAPSELENLRAVIEEKDREIKRLKKVTNLDQAKYFMRISVADSDALHLYGVMEMASNRFPLRINIRRVS